MRRLGPLLLVAACNPSGLTIEVVIDDPNIKKVELFAGDPCHPDCPRTTAPPGLPAMAVDDAFTVADPKPFTVLEQDFSDGVAGFRIESPADATLAILVIVGYDANNDIRWSWSKHWVEIPDASSAHWQIHMLPTTAIGATLEAQPPGTMRIKDWPDPDGNPSCLLLEEWSDKPAPYRELITPKDDLDCDGVAAINECAPWIPNAVDSPPAIADASCAVTASHNNLPAVCQLGGPPCSETAPLPQDRCVALETPYCLPAAFCQCELQTDQGACLSQILMQGTRAGTVPHMKCVLALGANGERCDDSSLQLDAGVLLSSSSTKCTALRLNDGTLPIAFGSYLHIGEGKLRFENFVQPCKTDIVWEPGVPQAETFGVLEAELDNGYSLALPVRVEVIGCDDGVVSSCRIGVPGASAGETIYSCVGAEPIMVACSPDPNGLCDTGPLCEGRCCPAGEVCGLLGCSCGGGPTCMNGDTCERPTAQIDEPCGTMCCGVTAQCPL